MILGEQAKGRQGWCIFQNKELKNPRILKMFCQTLCPGRFLQTLLTGSFLMGISLGIKRPRHIRPGLAFDNNLSSYWQASGGRWGGEEFLSDIPPEKRCWNVNKFMKKTYVCRFFEMFMKCWIHAEMMISSVEKCIQNQDVACFFQIYLVDIYIYNSSVRSASQWLVIYCGP